MKEITPETKLNYKTSKDYEKLWELAQTERIICLVSVCGGEATDVASTQHEPSFDIEISSRGQMYVIGKTKAQFIERCELYNVEFIMPDSEVSV